VRQPTVRAFVRPRNIPSAPINRISRAQLERQLERKSPVGPASVLELRVPRVHDLHYIDSPGHQRTCWTQDANGTIKTCIYAVTPEKCKNGLHPLACGQCCGVGHGKQGKERCLADAVRPDVGYRFIEGLRKAQGCNPAEIRMIQKADKTPDDWDQSMIDTCDCL